MSVEHHKHRPIRSFVLRQGRMTTAQQRYLDNYMPQIGLPYQATAPLDFTEIFSRSAPTILEIGSGMGETTAHIAQNMPQTNFIAIEVHSPGVGNLCKLAAQQSLQNLRIIQHDAVEVLKQMIPLNSLAGLHLFFPDPWHKKRHHKRRIVQPAFVTLVAERLTQNGYLHFATDSSDYACWMMDMLSAEPLIRNSVSAYAPRPAYRPATKFETRGLRLGHQIHDLIFIRH